MPLACHSTKPHQAAQGRDWQQQRPEIRASRRIRHDPQAIFRSLGGAADAGKIGARWPSSLVSRLRLVSLATWSGRVRLGGNGTLMAGGSQDGDVVGRAGGVVTSNLTVRVPPT